MADDPASLERLPLAVLLDLRRRVLHLDADLEVAIFARMVQRDTVSEPGELLDVATAAQRLGTSTDSLYRKHKRLRLGYIDPLDGRLKFTAHEIAEYIKRQRR